MNKQAEKNRRRFEKRVAERRDKEELTLFSLENMNRREAERKRAALEDWRRRVR